MSSDKPNSKFNYLSHACQTIYPESKNIELNGFVKNGSRYFYLSGHCFDQGGILRICF